MRLLLDTHILIWIAAESDKLSAKTLARIADPANELVFSVASLWELAIKTAGKGSDLPIDVERLRSQLVASDYLELDVKAAHALETRKLPMVHRDPFDRILIAQARVEGMTLLTADRRILQYGAPTLKA